MKKSILFCALVFALMLAFAAPLSAAEFSDVSEDDWYYDYVYAFSEAGIVNGYPDGTFLPENPVKRGEFVKIIGTTIGMDFEEYQAYELPFTDVSADYWALPYIAWAYESGIVNGRSETTFAPEGFITRQEAAVMLYRLIHYLDMNLLEMNEPTEFTDAEDIADWAAEAVTAMQKAGVINGYLDGSFLPEANSKRSESLKMIACLMDSATDKEYSDTHIFDLEEGDQTVISDYIFTEDVIINGNNAEIYFANCYFGGNIILTADTYTRVFVDWNCYVEGKLIIDNNKKEATFEHAFPKFITNGYYEVECDDCIGAYVIISSNEVYFNGTEYTMKDSTFYDFESNTFVEYDETLHMANVLTAAQWWESGVKQFILISEYDHTLDRMEASGSVFNLDEADTVYATNSIYNEDVYINGDNAEVLFSNCVFYGDVIITADEGTRVIIDEQCEIYGDVIFENDVKEADMAYSMPKVVTYADINAIADECVGSVIACGGATLCYNGVDYTFADCDYFEDTLGNFVPYIGQEANGLYIGQWWESGTQVIFKMCFKE